MAIMYCICYLPAMCVFFYYFPYFLLEKQVLCSTGENIKILHVIKFSSNLFHSAIFLLQQLYGGKRCSESYVPYREMLDSFCYSFLSKLWLLLNSWNRNRSQINSRLTLNLCCNYSLHHMHPTTALSLCSWAQSIQYCHISSLCTQFCIILY